MKRKSKMSTALLIRLLGGLMVPFMICLLFIAIQIYQDIRVDKAEAYSSLLDVAAQNMDASVWRNR